MRKYLLPAVAAATMMLAALPLTAASAATHSVLTNSRVGGPNVKVGAMLKAGLRGKATLFTPGTKVGVTCRRASITDKVRKNPRAPGTAVEALVSQHFSHCSSNIPGTKGVKTIQVLRLPYRTTVSSGKRVVVFRLSTKLTLNTVLGALTCTYSAGSIHGTATNVGQLNIFKNQTFNLRSGSSACPKKGNLSVSFGPLTNVSVKGHPHVFVN